MIARRNIPREFAAWNRHWHAPFGRSWPIAYRWRDTWPALRYRGPFAHQRNAETREFEYPWAYDAVRACGKGLTVVEIGGGLSGLQFVLAAEGYRVINVDPGGGAREEWGFDATLHARLCDVFAAPVTLRPTSLSEAGLPDHSADVVLSVSVLEHLSPEGLSATIDSIGQVLKPEGTLVLTADLFLNLAPFTADEIGPWGRNVNLRDFLKRANLILTAGNEAELLGFPAFCHHTVLARQSDYLVGKAMSTAQCLLAGRRQLEPAATGEHR